MTLVYIVLGWLLTASASVACGTLFGLRVTLPLAFVLGAPVLSLVVFLLGAAGFVFKGTFLALSLLAIGLAIRKRSWRNLDPIHGERPFWIGFAPFTFLYLMNALAPEMSPDGMAYHLGLVARYYREHRVMAVPENMYAGLSQGIEMLFLHAFSFGRHSAAAMVHFTYLVSLALMMAHRFPGRVGTVAALLVYASPIVGIDGISAYVDVAVAAIWFALYLLVERGERPAAIGTLAGFAFAAKYTAGLALVYAIWKRRADALRIAAFASLFILPWVLKNWITLGNPVAPFANSIFDNPHVTVAFEREYSEWMSHYGLQGLRDWAWNITVRGETIGGFFGPMFLLAPLAWGEWMWIWPALTYPLNVGTRFLIPALPFVAIGMAKRLCRWTWLGTAVLVVHLLLSWPGVLKSYAWRYTWFLEGIPPMRAVTRKEPEDGYLNHKRAEYRTARMVETFVPAGERVFAFTPIPEAYTTRRILTGPYSAHGYRVRDVFAAVVDSGFQPTLKVEFSLSPARRVVRVRQDEIGGPDRWSVSEIEPKPRVVRASHYNYFTGDAFDGNPLTRWLCGWPLVRGQWIEIEYDRDVDRVALFSTRDQGRARLLVEGGRRAQSEIPPPDNLRRRAAKTVRGWGYRYFVVDAPDIGYRDFLAHRAEWGITELAERGTVKLFRID
ncbi:MAG: hypothetical protein SFV18_17125 [Bryobacteraceae bacterium]|nr:hypothetical protein [Bryobacteraceae bacterium]